MSDLWQDERVVQLWNQSFGVSADYVRAQLSRVPESYATLAFSGDVLDVMVYSFPCHWNKGGVSLKSAYTFGFAAREQVRGSGRALETLSRHFDQLREDQVCLSFLQAEYPGLVSYYQHKAQYCFTERISQHIYQQDTLPHTATLVVLTPTQAYEAALPLLSAHVNCLLPERDSFINSGYYAEFIGVSDSNGCISGVLGYDRDSKEIFILRVADELAESVLAQYYMKVTGFTSVSVERPNERGNLLRRGCVRVINSESILEHPQFLSDFPTSFTLADSLIPANNRSIGLGNPLTFPKISIDQLARQIVPYMEMPLSYY